MRETVRCNLCGSDHTRLRFESTEPGFDDTQAWKAYLCTHSGYGVHGQIVECLNCGLIYTNPRRTLEAITENYETVEDPTYVEEQGARVLTFTRHLEHFERFTGPAAGRRILDVGAYIGVFLDVAAASGWEAWGLEPSLWAVRQMEGRGLKGVQGSLPQDLHKLPLASFDAVTMWDVIEHVPDPLACLQSIEKLLKPGGWAAVHTMDIDSLFAKVMGKRWPWLMQMHIYYFSAKTLTEMAEKSGLKVMHCKPHGRYLHFGYLTTRLRPYSPLLADLALGLARTFGFEHWAVPLNFGDLITIYVQKP